MDQAEAKKILQQLAKREDLGNKICADCNNPNPQWASLGFAILVCLQCAGQHRGYGVHISFVRSISMDTWQEEQIKRMQIGGNLPFKQFLENYSPADQGGYTEGMSSYDKYHCHAASQYREKLDAELAGKPWAPSAPTSGTASPALSSSSTLRKARTTSSRQATGSTLRSHSGSPASFNNPSRGATPDPSAFDQKTANENYFANLGQANAARSADLPPSQGGRYQGFGSTPSPSPSQHPSYNLSSAAVPTFSEIQENPTAALSKGWSLLSTVVMGATRAVSENVIQPGMERVRDPALQSTVSGYLTEAQRMAAQAGSSANNWSKTQLGVDVADSVGGVVDNVREKLGGGPSRSGYGSLSQGPEYGESTSLYHDDDDDFFDHHTQGNTNTNTNLHQRNTNPTTTSSNNTKKGDDWDEWKDWD